MRAPAALLLVSLCARSGSAQTDAGPRILGIPQESTMRCRLTAAVLPEGGGNGIRLRFELGGVPPADSRSIEATFDSAGNARTLADMTVHSRADGTPLIEGATARFLAGGQVVGLHPRPGAAPNGAGDSLATATVDSSRFAPLSMEEQDRARALARWLWNHRCRRREPEDSVR